MLIVTGEVELAPGDVERIRAAAIAMMEATAAEPGCRFYRFYEDVGRPGVMRVYEEWESEEALAAHGRAPHMGVWRAALAEVGLLRREIWVLTGATARPV